MKQDQTLFFLVLVTVAGGIWMYSQRDAYTGFYYPNPDNLLRSIKSEEVFNSLQECRDWIGEQAGVYNSDGSAFDYECGKNCDLSGGKPYICEETLE